MLKINYNTQIEYTGSSKAVKKAMENVKRDIRNVCVETEENGNDILILTKESDKEQFEIKAEEDKLVIFAGDALGAVYGLYHISKEILGVQPFWFWNDQVFEKKKEYVEVTEIHISKQIMMQRQWF